MENNIKNLLQLRIPLINLIIGYLDDEDKIAVKDNIRSRRLVKIILDNMKCIYRNFYLCINSIDLVSKAYSVIQCASFNKSTLIVGNDKGRITLWNLFDSNKILTLNLNSNCEITLLLDVSQFQKNVIAVYSNDNILRFLDLNNYEFSVLQTNLIDVKNMIFKGHFNPKTNVFEEYFLIAGCENHINTFSLRERKIIRNEVYSNLHCMHIFHYIKGKDLLITANKANDIMLIYRDCVKSIGTDYFPTSCQYLNDNIIAIGGNESLNNVGRVILYDINEIEPRIIRILGKFPSVNKLLYLSEFHKDLLLVGCKDFLIIIKISTSERLKKLIVHKNVEMLVNLSSFAKKYIALIGTGEENYYPQHYADIWLCE